MQSQPLLAYYAGAYGPTLRIAIDSRADLVRAHRIFGELAAGEIHAVDFGEAMKSRADSLQSLQARSVRKRPSKVLEIEAQTAMGPIFVWSNIPCDWEECALKIEQLIEVDTPGHQYLTTEGVDDALVEFCYREESEWLSGEHA